RESLPLGAQCLQLVAPLRDELVLVLMVGGALLLVVHVFLPVGRGCLRIRHAYLSLNTYKPIFRLASMKRSRSPSSTAPVFEVSMSVRRSLIRDWSST